MHHLINDAEINANFLNSRLFHEALILFIVILEDLLIMLRGRYLVIMASQNDCF